jgi:hypothetical protein
MGDSDRYKSIKIWEGGLRGWTCPFNGISDRQLKGGSGNGASLYGSCVRGTWRGRTFFGALKRMKGRFWRPEPLFKGLSLATWSGLIYRDFEIWL